MSTLFRRSPKIILQLRRSHGLLEPGVLNEDRCSVIKLFEWEQLTEDECDSVFHIILEHVRLNV